MGGKGSKTKLSTKDMKMFICYDYLTRTDYEN